MFQSGALPSAMKHDFAKVPSVSIPRSQFDRSHRYKTTFDAGYLIPIYRDFAFPGDTKNLSMKFFARLATPLRPFMDNMYCDSQFIAVPIRLLFNNWERMNGAQDDPGDSTDFILPIMTSPVGGYLNQTLSDYLAIPTEVAGLEHHSLFHRAYNFIWNQLYRDENLQDSVVVDKDDGPDAPTDYTLLRRGKRYDYFTSSLPEPQKGPAVNIPLGTSAPVKRTPSAPGFVTGYVIGGNTLAAAGALALDGASRLTDGAAASITLDPGTSLYADLSVAASATINVMRESVTVQQVYELDNLGGTRYTEIIYAHFRVVSPDARLQRPEYLGGDSSPITVHPIAQTSESTAGNPQGNLTAMATVSDAGKRHGFVKSFTEHCVILGLVSIRADLNYQQGLERIFSYSTRFDFYLPIFANLGEQGILNKEIYAQGSAAPTVDAAVFAYQERFAELRYKPSYVTGRFRSNYAQSLDSYHLAQDFGALPVLDSDFIEENPPVDRIVALQTGEPQFIFDAWFRLIEARPMPTFSVPGLTRF